MDDNGLADPFCVAVPKDSDGKAKLKLEEQRTSIVKENLNRNSLFIPLPASTPTCST